MIRFIKAHDSDECIAMLEEFYRTDAVSHTIPNDYIKNTINAALNNSPYVKIIICEVDGDYAGFCTLSLSFSTEAGGIVVFIEELYVRDNFKGQGHGSDILDFIRQEFDSKVKRYRLEVTPQNEGAIRLYQKLGFEELSYKQMVLDL